jgi:hypothetical protein
MRARPLTVLTPVPWWWGLWIRFSWKLIDLLGLARLVEAPLRKLSFIHFARWAVVGRWPPDRGGARDRSAPRSLLFLTSFDGSTTQYIDAFVRVVPGRIAGLYAGAKGFPGPFRFGSVERYILDHSHDVDHFWMAHPQASTTMVSQALALSRVYAAFEPRLRRAPDPKSFAREWRRFLTAGQGYL